MEPPTRLIPWFSKTEGNTYSTLLHHRFLFRENQRSAQEVAVTGMPSPMLYANQIKIIANKTSPGLFLVGGTRCFEQAMD